MILCFGLEEYLEGLLADGIKACPDFQIAPLNHDRYIAMSALQKGIRCGAIDLSLSAGLQLLNADPRSFWRRLCVIAFEDIGIANMDLLGQVTHAAGSKRLREKLGGDPKLAQALIWQMCVSRKDRTADDLYELVERDPLLVRYKDELAELGFEERLARARNPHLNVYKRATASYAASWGLEGDIKGNDAPFCRSGFFERLAEGSKLHGNLQIAQWGFSRSGCALPVFIPLIAEILPPRGLSTSDDEFLPTPTIGGLPAWVFNGHTRAGLAACGEFAKTPRMRGLIAEYRTRDLSAAKIVAALLFRLESGQLTNRLHWSEGDEIREYTEQLGWGIKTKAVPEAYRTMREEWKVFNEIRKDLVLVYLSKV